MGKLNKKGIVFTFISVVLVSILIIAFLINIDNRSKNNIQVTNVKTETLNSFVKSLNSSFIPDALKVSSNQAMISLLDYESNESIYIQDLSDYFKEVLETGNYNGEKQDGMFRENLDYRLNPALNEIKLLAQEQGAFFDYSPIDYNSIKIFQRDPWHIIVSLKFSYTLRDAKNELIWDIKNREIYSVLNVENYRDPLYLLEPEMGKLSLRITKTPYTQREFHDINKFNDHIIKGYFAYNSGAPSFIKRLKGDFSKDNNGIESLLDPVYFYKNGLYSNADYQFISKVLGECVDDMDSSFKLDASHLNYYQRKSDKCKGSF